MISDWLHLLPYFLYDFSIVTRGFSRFANLLITTRLHVKNKHTISDIFQETVSKHPQKAAIVFEKRTWTFKEVDEYSNRIANFFKSQGYQKGDVVALYLENCPEFICIWLGLSKLGVVTALINTNLRSDSLFHCISVASVRAVIFGTDLSGNLIEISLFRDRVKHLRGRSLLLGLLNEIANLLVWRVNFCIG